jgi:serine phosphatase RsbU (regulator of sigma subunit)
MGLPINLAGRTAKKFMIRRFKEMLQKMHTKPVEDQQVLMDKQLKNWKGNLEQIDDIVVMGVRIS